MAIELEDDHYQSHANEPDPDCAQCRETWDYYAEAVRIVEGDSLLIPSRKHLEAAVEKVQEREAVIVALRSLLEEAQVSLETLQWIARGMGNLSLDQIENDVNGVNDGKQRAIYLRNFIGAARNILRFSDEQRIAGATGGKNAAIINRIISTLAATWPKGAGR